MTENTSVNNSGWSLSWESARSMAFSAWSMASSAAGTLVEAGSAVKEQMGEAANNVQDFLQGVEGISASAQPLALPPQTFRSQVEEFEKDEKLTALLNYPLTEDQCKLLVEGSISIISTLENGCPTEAKKVADSDQVESLLAKYRDEGIQIIIAKAFSQQKWAGLLSAGELDVNGKNVSFSFLADNLVDVPAKKKRIEIYASWLEESVDHNLAWLINAKNDGTGYTLEDCLSLLSTDKILNYFAQKAELEDGSEAKQKLGEELGLLDKSEEVVDQGAALSLSPSSSLSINGQEEEANAFETDAANLSETEETNPSVEEEVTAPKTEETNPSETNEANEANSEEEVSFDQAEKEEEETPSTGAAGSSNKNKPIEQQSQTSWQWVSSFLTVREEDSIIAKTAKYVGLFFSWTVFIPVTLITCYIVCPLVDRCCQIQVVSGEEGVEKASC